MTKKDYKLIADTLKECGGYTLEPKMFGYQETWEAYKMFKSIAFNLSEKLQSENPCFNREKFLTACGFIN